MSDTLKASISLKEETIKLLKTVRLSKTLSLTSIQAIISDYDNLGPGKFFELTEKELTQRSRRPRAAKLEKDPLMQQIEKIQKKTMKTKPFIKAIMEKARNESIQFKSRATPTSIPKLITLFREQASEEKLLALTNLIFEANSRAHNSFR